MIRWNPGNQTQSLFKFCWTVFNNVNGDLFLFQYKKLSTISDFSVCRVDYTLFKHVTYFFSAWMEGGNRTFVLAALSALMTMPPHIKQYLCKLVLEILIFVFLPPHPIENSRNWLSFDSQTWSGKDIFFLFSKNRFGFHQITGETLLEFRTEIHTSHAIWKNLTHLDFHLEIEYCYFSFGCDVTQHTICSLFDISISTVKVLLQSLTPSFYRICSSYLHGHQSMSGVIWCTHDQTSHLPLVQ